MSAVHRRSVLQALVTLPTAAVSLGGAASASTAVTDPTVCDFTQQFETVTGRLALASDRLDQAFERLGEHPDRPAELRVKTSDYWMFSVIGVWDTDGYWFDSESVEKVRTMPLVLGDAYAPGIPRPNVEGRLRRDVVVGAWDRWRAVIKAREDAAGYTEASREHDVIATEHEAIRVRIIDLRSSDPAVLALKVRLLVWSSGSRTYCDRVVAHALQHGDTYADAVLMSIARDVVFPVLPE